MSRKFGKSISVAIPLAEGEERRNLRVRSEPDGVVVGTLEPGNEFVIVGDAICSADRLLWWEIETIDGSLRGWSVEGFAPDDYLMVPIP